MLRFKAKIAMKTKKIDLAYLNRRTPLWKPLLFILPAMLVLAGFTVYPFYVSILKAFHPPRHHSAIPGDFSLDSFKSVIENHYFRQSLSNSIVYAFISIPISIMVSLTIAATISSIIRKRARGAWQTIFFLPYVTSGVAVSLAFAYLFSNNGILNQIFGTNTPWLNDSRDGSKLSLIVIIIKGIWSAIAFQVLIFTTAMLGVDKDRYKAASIDGAGPVKQFFKITLPSINRTLNFIITVGLIGAIKVFPLALFQMDPVLAQQNNGSTLMLFVFKAVQEGKFSVAGASAIILVGISISFSVIVKQSFNLLFRLIEKGGEIRVKHKIKNFK